MLRVFSITSISCAESIKPELNLALDEVLVFFISIKVLTDSSEGSM